MKHFNMVNKFFVSFRYYPFILQWLKSKLLKVNPGLLGFFFSFVCLGTLLLPYQLLSSINNTVSTKFKFLYEMLTNLILFSFFFYHLYYLIIFQKSDLNDMVFDGELWELGDIPPIRCVSGRNGYLWNTIISSNRWFFFKSKYNLIMYTNIIYSANYARWNIFRSIRRYHPDIYQLPSAKCLSELLILKRKVL